MEFSLAFQVYKTGVTHYFSTQKAKRELGYVPIVQNDVSEVVEYFIQTGHKRKKSGSSPLKHFIINLIIGFIFAAFIMSYLPLVRQTLSAQHCYLKSSFKHFSIYIYMLFSGTKSFGRIFIPVILENQSLIGVGMCFLTKTWFSQHKTVTS